MPRYKVRDKVTGEYLEFSWPSGPAPTDRDIDTLMEQKRQSRIEAFKKMRETEEAAPLKEKLLVQSARPIMDVVQDPNVSMPMKAGGIATGLGLGFIESLDPSIALRGLRTLYGRPTIEQIPGVPEGGQQTVTRPLPPPGGRRIASGVTDIASGGLAAAAPFGLGAIAKHGVKPLVRGAVQFGAAEAAARKTGEALDLPEEYSRLMGLVGGTVGASFGSPVRYGADKPSPAARPGTVKVTLPTELPPGSGGGAMVRVGPLPTPQRGAGGGIQQPGGIQQALPAGPPVVTPPQLPPAPPNMRSRLLPAPEAPIGPPARMGDAIPQLGDIQRALPPATVERTPGGGIPLPGTVRKPRVRQPAEVATPTEEILTSGGPTTSARVMRRESASKSSKPSETQEALDILKGTSAGVEASDTIRLYRVGGLKPSDRLPTWLEGSETAQAIGRWWTHKREIADWYARPEHAPPGTPRYYVDVPRAVYEKSRVANQPSGVKKFSRDPENEVFLSREWVEKAVREGEPAKPPRPVSARRKKTQEGFISFGGRPRARRVQDQQVNRARAEIVEQIRNKVINNEPLTPFEQQHFENWARPEVMSFNRPSTVFGRALYTLRGYMKTDKFLEENPWTRPVAENIKTAAAEGDIWEVSVFKRFNEAFGKAGRLSKTERGKLVGLMNGQTVVASDKLHQLHKDLRGIFDDIFIFAEQQGVTRKSGNAIQYLKDYFPHILRRESLPEELWGNFQAYGDRIFKGKKIQPEKVDIGGKVGSTGLYEPPPGKTGSPYVEHRFGTDLPLETNPNEIIRIYVKSMRGHIFDKPAVESIKGHLARLPEGSIEKSHATWYAKNWARNDLYDLGKRHWRYWDRAIAGAGARSALTLSTRLQLLHLARMGMQVWPEIGTGQFIRATGKFALNPSKSIKQARDYGLLSSTMPWRFKRAGEKFSAIGNFGDVGNAVAKAVTLESQIHKFKTVLKDPDWKVKAINETKRIEGVVKPETASRFAETLPRNVLQFKNWLINYGSLVGDAAKEGEIRKLGRYMFAALLLEEMTRATGRTFWHLGQGGKEDEPLEAKSVPERLVKLPIQAAGALTQMPGIVPKATGRALRQAEKGEYKEAAKTMAKTFIPNSHVLRDLSESLMNGDLEGAIKAFDPLSH